MKKISYEYCRSTRTSTSFLSLSPATVQRLLFSCGNVEITKICSGAEPASWHSSTVIRNSPAI